jgi:hypothetical protein
MVHGPYAAVYWYIYPIESGGTVHRVVCTCRMGKVGSEL